MQMRFKLPRPAAFDNPAPTPATVVNPDDPLWDLDTPSPDAAAMASYWAAVDAVLSGADAMKAAAQMYLPKFTGETINDYKFRLACAKFTNVFRDIVENLASRPFSVPVKVDEGTIPVQIRDFIEDVDGSGNDLTVFAVDLFFNGIANAIDWIFVDYPNAPVAGQARSVEEEKKLGLRPFWSHVRGANVLEVRTEIINGSEQLKYIRMIEYIDGAKYIRVIERNSETVWSLYKYVGNEGKRSKFQKVEGGIISINLIPLVPFITGRRNGKSWQFFPAMRDALDLQIVLYQNETGLEYAKRMTAYPMLAGNGVKVPKAPDGKPLPIPVGPGRTLISEPDGQGNSGSWAFIEPGATSLQFLAQDNKDTITQLRELGRQPLTTQSGNLTVITTAVAAQKGDSAVQMWAVGADVALEKALQITSLWYGTGEIKPDVTVDTDFSVNDDGPEQITALQGMRAARDLSLETYWDEMQRRDVLGPKFDPARERERLLEEVPGDDFEDEPTNPPDDPPTRDPDQPELPL